MSTVVPEETLNTNIEASDNSKEEEASRNEASVEDGAAKGESAESGNESVDKKKKPKKKSRRLSFADEHGQDIKEVTYHSNLHYSTPEDELKAQNKGGSGCCIVS